jgi:multiple sugar transport system permease protein
MSAQAPSASRLARGGGRARVSWWLFLPTLVPVFVLSVVPLLQGIYLGFTDYTLGAPERRFIGLENFARMLKDTQFWSSFQIGAIWTVTVTLGVLVLGLSLALLLNARLPGQGVARVLVLIPWAIPPVIKGVIWRLVYNPGAGYLNSALVGLRLISSPVDWLNDFTWALPAVIVVGIWTGLPQATVVLLAGLQSMPDELHEAAALDGASGWHRLRYVTLPLMVPVILATGALEFMWNFNSFGLVYVLTQGGPAGTTRLPMLFAYEEGFQFGNIAYASALGLAMVVIVGAILLYTVRNQYLSAKEA